MTFLGSFSGSFFEDLFMFSMKPSKVKPFLFLCTKIICNDGVKKQKEVHPVIIST
jgi:hypothetical protein